MSRSFLDGDDRYDGTKAKIHAFLRETKRHVKKYGLLQALRIELGNPPVQKNLLDSYGEVPMAAVKMKADQVWTDAARFQERIRHNILGNAVWDSLSNTAKLQISGDSAMYERVDGIDGPCLLRLLLKYTTSGKQAFLTLKNVSTSFIWTISSTTLRK
ncbi:MAG: hypothetical protein ACXW1N_07285 [Halobacteriota archaeon]